MNIAYGYKCFGFFSGLPYGDCDEDFLSSEYQRTDCKLSREDIIRHFDTLDPALTSAWTEDPFTNEEIQCGLYDDGDFSFTTEFVKYYKDGKVEIPKEYEDYLRDKS